MDLLRSLSFLFRSFFHLFSLLSCISVFKDLLLLFSRCHVRFFATPHALQHTRLSCLSPSPRVCSNSCPLSWWSVQPSHPLSPTSPPALNLSQQGLGIILSEDAWTTSVHFIISQSVHRTHMSQQSNPHCSIAIICPISSHNKANLTFGPDSKC